MIIIIFDISEIFKNILTYGQIYRMSIKLYHIMHQKFVFWSCTRLHIDISDCFVFAIDMIAILLKKSQIRFVISF